MGVNQNGVLNSFFGVQAANDRNSIVVNQSGIKAFSNVQQVNTNGANNAYITQDASYNSSDLTQVGKSNTAGVVQHSHVGRGAPSSPSSSIGVGGDNTAFSKGPVFQSWRDAEGNYLSLFETGGMNLVTYTSGGMTVTSGFGRQH